MKKPKPPRVPATTLFAEALKQKMAEKKVTIRGLAAKAKVDPVTVMNARKGERSPTIATAEAIARALRTPLYRMLRRRKDGTF